jgi:hypothetical protein
VTGKCCPKCGVRYVTGDIGSRRRPSRDHILPQSRGGRQNIHGAKNIVTMCQECNGWRAACGHCWAIAACVDAVAGTESVDRWKIYKRWRLAHMDNPEEIARAARKARSFAAVRIGRKVERIGLDEFVWPADTAAKRVWNLATLARGSGRTQSETPAGGATDR